MPVRQGRCWCGIFYAINSTLGLRVSAAEELEGLDLTEHGIYAYPPGFVNGVPPVADAPGAAVAAGPALEPA